MNPFYPRCLKNLGVSSLDHALHCVLLFDRFLCSGYLITPRDFTAIDPASCCQRRQSRYALARMSTAARMRESRSCFENAHQTGST